MGAYRPAQPSILEVRTSIRAKAPSDRATADERAARDTANGFNFDSGVASFVVRGLHLLSVRYA